MSISDQITDILYNYPMLWIISPAILLAIPIALLIGLLLPRKKQHPDQQHRPSSVDNRGSKSSKKSVKSDQSDGDTTNKQKNKPRYIVRSKNSEVEEEREEPSDLEETKNWSFPPDLEEFNLMDLDVDPGMIEEIFNDKRLIQVIVRLRPGQGLGLTIVGGKDSVNGDAPIYVKRVLGDSVLQKEGKLKTGDELIAVNDVLLVNATKEHASEVLSNVEGCVRLLAIQDL